MPEGKLIVTAKKILQVSFTSRNGRSVTATVPNGELSATLKAKPLASLDGCAVELELDEKSGQPRHVRPVGEAWQTAPSPSPPPPAYQPQQAHAAAHGLPPADFLNPYNFVPTPPRNLAHPELGDRAPYGHDRLKPGTLTGVIRVKLTTKTPLLIVDPGTATDGPSGHKTFGVRLVDGKPYLAPTAVKGMLRSAYEAVTNSRFGVFPGRPGSNGQPGTGHAARLALRMPAGEGLSLVPARVENGQITLLLGTTIGFPTWNSNLERWQIPGDLIYSAWLKRYLVEPIYFKGTNRRPSHGDQVHCWVQKIQHWRYIRSLNRFVRDFQFWDVRAIVPNAGELGPAPSPAPGHPPNQPATAHVPDTKTHYEPLPQVMQISGWVCATNQNIKGKHDERVFFAPKSGTTPQPLTADIEHAWGELIRDYQVVHEKELADRKRKGEPFDMYLGHQPGKTAWSRHVYTPGADRLDQQPTLCYAYVDSATGRVQALYPVSISRKLYAASPLASLRDSHLPAARPDELSPADRVFGWVNPAGPGAHRGQLRVGHVTCERADAVHTFENGTLPLAILGQPKPAQARFYLRDKSGSAGEQNGRSKEAAGYDGKKLLRGRKVYPHHKPEAASAGYWDWSPTADREYARPLRSPIKRDSQNRSITGWVKENTTFTFDLHVTNLSQVELGALAWLLDLGPDHFHRLGLGKPLGFGSVSLTVMGNDTRDAEGTDVPDTDRTAIRDADGWKKVYASFDPPLPKGDYLAAAKVAFQAVSNPVVLEAFLAATKGFDLPTHYPRRSPLGEMYEWFVESERTRRVALPDLTAKPNPGLPSLG